jgi:hypothetical protein
MLSDQLQREFIPLVAQFYAATESIEQLVTAGKPLGAAAAEELVNRRRALGEYFERAGAAIAATPRPVRQQGGANGHG